MREKVCFFFLIRIYILFIKKYHKLKLKLKLNWKRQWLMWTNKWMKNGKYVLCIKMKQRYYYSFILRCLIRHEMKRSWLKRNQWFRKCLYSVEIKRQRRMWHRGAISLSGGIGPNGSPGVIWFRNCLYSVEKNSDIKNSFVWCGKCMKYVCFYCLNHS